MNRLGHLVSHRPERLFADFHADEIIVLVMQYFS
jgi:hypothetical protein